MLKQELLHSACKQWYVASQIILIATDKLCTVATVHSLRLSDMFRHVTYKAFLVYTNYVCVQGQRECEYSTASYVLRVQQRNYVIKTMWSHLLVIDYIGSYAI